MTILFVCDSGAGWVQTTGRFPVTENECILIPPGTPHSYGADDTRPWSIRWVHFRGTEAPEFCRLLQAGCDPPVIGLPSHAGEAIDMASIYAELEHGYSPASLLSAAARLKVALATINHLRIHGNPRSQAAAGDAIQKSLDWMRRHVQTRAKLGELASMAGLSVPHYSTLFRRRTGYAPIDHFLRMKVQQACQLLDTSSLRISEVASAVGCEDPFYFSRLFKKITGQSPREYRKVPKG